MRQSLRRMILVVMGRVQVLYIFNDINKLKLLIFQLLSILNFTYRINFHVRPSRVLLGTDSFAETQTEEEYLKLQSNLYVFVFNFIFANLIKCAYRQNARHIVLLILWNLQNRNYLCIGENKLLDWILNTFKSNWEQLAEKIKSLECPCRYGILSLVNQIVIFNENVVFRLAVCTNE